MFLLRIIPTTKIPLPAPQILTYFSSSEIAMGSLVLIPVHKRQTIGVVFSVEKLSRQKMDIRQADYELRGIAKIISQETIISEKQLLFAKWLSDYYYCPLGAILKLMLPIKNQKVKSKNQNSNSKLKTDQIVKQKLILVPEISFINRISKENNIADFATMHSGQTDKQHYENWLKIKNGETENIIATRMALFALYNNLTEIIVEDEHNDLYKSRQTPRYHAREVALKLAEIWGAKITLKSPTPSIEASWLAKNKKINLRHLKSKIPNLTSVIDLREELKSNNFSIFSRVLQEKIKSALSKKEQIILFINRRGASTVLICRDCGYSPKCPNCDTPLVYHLFPIQFICHRCGHQEFPPVVCPSCLGTRIKFLGTGTQKVEAEFKKLFPEVKIARLDSDVILSSAIPPPSSFIPAPSPFAPLHKEKKAGIQIKKIIDDFNSQKIQVLITTTIIFNKGLNQANLVAMMIADTILHLPDFRSNERTFQTISRLTTLAKEEFLLQTYSPKNPAMRFAIKNDYQSFCQGEIDARQEFFYPPFSQLIKLTFQNKSAKKAEDEAKILTEKLKQQINIVEKNSKLQTYNLTTILGPSPAFVPKVNGKYIWQIILKTKLNDLNLRNKILQIIPPNWIIDIDPLDII